MKHYSYNKKISQIKDVEIFVGIDIGRNKHYMSLINKEGYIIKKGIGITNDRYGFNKLLKILRETVHDKDKIAIGVEPTGHYWKPLGYYLTDRGFHLYLVNPYHVKLSKELRDNTPRKTDKKDTLIIANLVREGKFLSNRLLKGNYAILRRLVITRERIIKEIQRTKIRIISILDEYLPEYRNSFSNITIKTSIYLLEKYGISGLRKKNNQKAKEENNQEEIIRDIYSVSRGRISKTRARFIVNRFKDSIGVTEGLYVIDKELHTYLGILKDYTDNLNNIEKEIINTLRGTKEYEYIISIRGVGYITAAIILGEVGSFDNFNNPGQIRKLAGLNLKETSSGEKTGRRSISKRGRKLLRHGLYRIAIVSIVNNEELKRLYRYKVDICKKNKMVAIVSIALKILRIMFSLVKHKDMYDPNKVLETIPKVAITTTSLS